MIKSFIQPAPGLFPRSRPVSTEQVYFYGAGLFLRSRIVSTEQACFYGAGLFPRSRPVSTEKACCHGAGLFLRRAGLFLPSRPIFLRRVCVFSKMRRCVPCGPPYITSIDAITMTTGSLCSW